MKHYAIMDYMTKKRLLTALVALAALVPAFFYLDCDSTENDDRGLKSMLMYAAGMGSITLQHTLSGMPDGVDHLHYRGYDASGNLVYESPEMKKSDIHTLAWVPRNVVRLTAEFQTDFHEELNAISYTVDFGGTSSLVIAPACYHATEFNPDRLALVDENSGNGNLLVRGNLPMITNGPDSCPLPVNERSFAYDRLNEKMGKIITGFNLDEYEIIDITLIDNQSDKNQFTAELNVYGYTPETLTCGTEWPPYNNSCAWDPTKIFETTHGAGQHPWGIVWWPIYACGTIHCTSDAAVGLDNFDFKDLPGYLETLLAGAPASGKSKRLIYFHCMQGTDRTGALHAAYLMHKDSALTLKNAVAQATKGFQRGHEQQQLNPVLVPSCTYIGLVEQLCLRSHPGDTAHCGFDEKTDCK